MERNTKCNSIKKILPKILLKYLILDKKLWKKLKLPNVTLLAATSSEMDEAQVSMRISLQNIEFGAAKLLCTTAPKQKYPDIEYVSIPPLIAWMIIMK